MGAAYALVALGYSMQYAAMRLINFAHGESFALGAFVALTLAGVGFGPVSAFAVALIIMAAIGAVLEIVLIRRLYDMPELLMLVVTIGISLVVRQGINLVWGADPRAFSMGQLDGMIELGPVVATYQQLTVIGATVALVVSLQAFLTHSRTGVGMRAVAQDVRTAALMGIPVDNVRTIVFAISTALGAAAGVLFASLTFASFDMGLWMGIKGFAAAVLGGLGSLPGAVAGGLILGFLEQFGSGYVSSLYRDVTALAVLIAVLLLRPQGLLGGSSAWGKV